MRALSFDDMSGSFIIPLGLTVDRTVVEVLPVRLFCSMTFFINHSAWGHLNPSSYCDVGRLFYGVFKLWSKLQRKKNEEIICRNSLPHYKRASSFTNKREAA